MLLQPLPGKEPGRAQEEEAKDGEGGGEGERGLVAWDAGPCGRVYGTPVVLTICTFRHPPVTAATTLTAQESDGHVAAMKVGGMKGLLGACMVPRLLSFQHFLTMHCLNRCTTLPWMGALFGQFEHRAGKSSSYSRPRQ